MRLRLFNAISSFTDPKSLPGVPSAIRLLPLSLLKHWLYPFFVRGSRRAYNGQVFFESWYRSSAELTDGLTISQNYNPFWTRYHYNATECSIIRGFAARGYPMQPTVLDIGSGAGHWVDFYRNVFAARSVTAVEFVEEVCEKLRLRYRGQPVKVLNADVSAQGFNPGKFDIINAIGVMFHIVDDTAWERAIRNLARSLAPGGTIIVGGQFGWLTRSVQFHRKDLFGSWREAQAAECSEVLVNKRIRSLRVWKAATAAAGLRVIGVVRTSAVRGIPTPENHILLIRASGSSKRGTKSNVQI